MIHLMDLAQGLASDNPSGNVGPRLSHHLESLSWYRLQATGPASGTQTPSTHVCPCQARNPQTYLSGGNRESCTTELGEMPKG